MPSGRAEHLPPAHPPVIPALLHNALKGSSMVIHGKGEQPRDYVFIDDVVDALVVASTAPGIDRLVINVGSGVDTSVNDLIEAMSGVMGRVLVPLHIPAEDG